MAIQEKDFITLNYTGKLEDGTVFDTTEEQIAKQAGIYNQQSTYGPVTICVGQKHILPGLDKALVGATVGKHQIMLPPESGFGKKSAKKVQLIATSKFKKDKINPYPSLQVNVDNQIGVVKNVSGGRTLVDFNHPLAGANVVYEVDITKQVTDLGEQGQAMVTLMFGPTAKTDFKDGVLTIKSHMPVPDAYKAQLEEKITQVIDGIKKIDFKTIEHKKEETTKV